MHRTPSPCQLLLAVCCCRVLIGVWQPICKLYWHIGSAANGAAGLEACSSRPTCFQGGMLSDTYLLRPPAACPLGLHLVPEN